MSSEVINAEVLVERVQSLAKGKYAPREGYDYGHVFVNVSGNPTGQNFAYFRIPYEYSLKDALDLLAWDFYRGPDEADMAQAIEAIRNLEIEELKGRDEIAYFPEKVHIVIQSESVDFEFNNKVQFTRCVALRTEWSACDYVVCLSDGRWILITVNVYA